LKRQNSRKSERPAGERKNYFQSPWFAGLLLLALTVIAYWPATRAGFVWDDDEYVTNNPLLTAPDGLWRIWFSFDSPSQYFPLTYSVFLVERIFWGLNPAGYHWFNILLHATNALLVWRLLKGLGVPGAWLAAAIFSLHPVQVESVAWITELKNTLSLFFSLLALLAWGAFTSENSSRPWRLYFLALGFFALALASKTTACMLPAAMLLVLWLKRKPIGWPWLAQMIPFLALGVLMGWLTMWWERVHQGTQGKLFALGLPERMLIASHAVWFYLGKLVWPADLIFSYPRWPVDAANLIAWSWLAAIAGAVAAVYFARRRAGRGLEVAGLFFVAMLSPMLGFIMLYTFRYSFAADHYQYVAAIGPIALAAAGITTALDRVAKNNPLLKMAGVGILLAALGGLTWRQCGMYASLETLWRTTLERNPGSFLAQNNFGYVLLQKGQVNEAIVRYRKSLELEPDYELAHYNLGNALLQKGQVDEAVVEYKKALEIRPNIAEFHNNLGTALLRKRSWDEAIAQFQRSLEIAPANANAHNNLAIALRRKGRLAEAMAHYQQALKLQPQNAAVMNNLAWLLATCPPAALRDGHQAVALAQQANQLAGGSNALVLQTLAAACAETGRYDDAIAAAQKALNFATGQGDATLAKNLQEQIAVYQSGSALRDASLTNTASSQPP
jgi:tetratricopeptide (TPR) repeat protein